MFQRGLTAAGVALIQKGFWARQCHFMLQSGAILCFKAQGERSETKESGRTNSGGYSSPGRPLWKRVSTGLSKLTDQFVNDRTAAVERLDQPIQTIFIPFIPLLRCVGRQSPDFVRIHALRTIRMKGKGLMTLDQEWWRNIGLLFRNWHLPTSCLDVNNVLRHHI